MATNKRRHAIVGIKRAMRGRARPRDERRTRRLLESIDITPPTSTEPETVHEQWRRAFRQVHGYQAPS